MRRKILAVDDSAVNRQLLRKILQGEYEVLEAENGKAALEILRASYESISAVLLDIIMPVMDGYEVLSQMCADEHLSRIPVIVTTASAREDAEIKALSLGANDFIVKPYLPQVIRQRLRNTINLRETAAIANFAQRDRLTGLYNRETFFDRAAELIAAHAPGYYVMSCYDINQFKVINDQYGTDKGDQVLRHVARAMLRGFEKLEGLCCRVTADNFATLYPRKYLGSEELGQIWRAAAAFDENIHIVFSVGRYIVDDLSLSVSAMYDRAALAENTVSGRFDEHIALYDESMRTRLLREQEITGEMNRALEGGQFEVWFQPQYNHASGALIGAEALVRWRSSKRGLISPGIFIPVFERNGFIYELDKYVWEQACRLLREWIDGGRAVLPVSVNISRYDVFRDDLIDVITGLVQKYRLPVDLLRLEITESAFAESADQIIDVVKRLVACGFTLEIDDFGSGYSSLNTLKDVPAQVLKLDMRFLENDRNSQRGGNILESIVRMAKWLGMSVIAEGVETVEQANFLKSIGCNYVQGYLYARPMPAREYEALFGRAGKEERLLALETVKNLDNNAFWDPKSIDTLIFNSFVGGAGVFEYYRGTIELLRANDKYAQVIGSAGMRVEDALKLNWAEHLDDENRRALHDALVRSIDSEEEITGEYMFLNLPGCPEKTYLRVTLRVIASAGERHLIYCTNENSTAQRVAEQKERMVSQQFKAIMDNVGSGVTAGILEGKDVRFLFANDKYFELLGYTRDQYAREVRSVFDIIRPADRAEVIRVAQEAYRAQGSAQAEYRVIRRDGRERWMRIVLSKTRFAGLDQPVQLSILTDITEEKQAEQQLRDTDEQLRFLNDIAHDLLARPDIQEGVERVLKKLLDYFDGNRAYIFEFDYERGITSNTFEVCARGVDSEKDRLKNLPIAACEFWIRAFDARRYIVIDDVDALDESRAEERRILKEQNIRSLCAAPLRRNGRLIGFIGIDDPKRKQSLVDRLDALGDYLSVMLTRRDLRAKIDSDHKTMARMMDDMPGGFARMRLCPDGSVATEYVNDRLCQLRGMPREKIMRIERVNALDSVRPDDLPAIRAAMGEMIVSGEMRSMVCHLRCADGSYARLTAFGCASKDSAGATYINVYFVDLSRLQVRENAL